MTDQAGAQTGSATPSLCHHQASLIRPIRRGAVFVLIAAGLVMVLAACGERGGEGQAQAQDAPPTVTVANPVQREVTEWDEYVGRFRAVDHVEVRARVSGYLQSVEFKDGQLVEAGDLLFVIDPRPFQVQVDQAKAALDEARSQVRLALRDVNRARPLLERGNIAESTFDERLQALEEGRASVKVAEAALAAAELELEFTTVEAPVAGRMSRTQVTLGNLVTGGAAGATLLTTLVSTDPIHFYFDVSEADYLKYTRLDREGARPSSRETANPVRLALLDEDEFVHEGRMDFVENTVDFDSGTVTGRALVDNPDGLLIPGLFAKIRLVGSGTYDALLLPDEVIGTDQNNRFVLTVGEDNTARYNQVTLGPIIDGLRVIRSGISADDRVITNGLQRARPGAPVTPEEGEIEAVS
jgi:RND family efflux transporter MFP subunit